MDSTRIQMPFMSERNRKMENNEQDFINIINATENNLKHVSLKIPKKQISVDISHILGNLITVIFDYQILRKPLKILSL